MRGVALYSFHQIGDEVLPPLELDVDLRPRIVRAIAEPDEPVVDRNDPQHDDADSDSDDDSHVARVLRHLRGKRLISGAVVPFVDSPENK